MDLGDAVGDALRQPEPWRVGTVTGTSGQKVVLTVSGESYTLPRLTSYTPTNGDVVMIAWPEGRPFVVGKIAV